MAMQQGRECDCSEGRLYYRPRRSRVPRPRPPDVIWGETRVRMPGPVVFFAPGIDADARFEGRLPRHLRLWDTVLRTPVVL